MEFFLLFNARTCYVIGFFFIFTLQESSDVPMFGGLINNVTASVTRDATLPCIVENLSSYKVAWLRVDTQTILTIAGHVITKNHRISVTHSDQRTWSLHIKDVRESDQGWYMCQLNTDPMKSQTAFLEVVVPPDILDYPTSTDMVAREGNDVTLRCAASGSPTPTVAWRRESSKGISLGNGTYVSAVDGPFLHIPKVTRHDMGAYLCIASNGIPPTVSKRILLIVHFPPSIWVGRQLIGAMVNRPANLECHSEAFPNAVNYWTREKGEILTRGTKYDLFTEESTYKVMMKLTIKNVTAKDFGTYKCVSKNALGDTEGSMKVYAIPHSAINGHKIAGVIARNNSNGFSGLDRVSDSDYTGMHRDHDLGDEVEDSLNGILDQFGTSSTSASSRLVLSVIFLIVVAYLGIAWVVLLALLNCPSHQYQPIELHSEECALLLDGPGRSSAFDYQFNALRGTFGYDGPHTCITYDAVNQAYIQARKRIHLTLPKGEWKPEDIAPIGELLLDISINLAKTYGLSYEDIEKGLPLIDTSKTLIREVCPPFLSNVECRPGKFRRYDGLCTNLQHPTWGATNTPFTRLVGPLYADGMTAPRISVLGTQLPLPRIVSRTVHPDEGFHDHAGTVMVVAWGQFMDHDYTLTATPLDPLNRNEPEECCNRPPHLKNPYCLEITIPEDDYFYGHTGVRCQDFVRGFVAVRPGCRLGSRSQFNTLTGVLDGNTIYGVTESFARKLRAGYGGLLRMNPVFSEYGLKDLLPLKLDIPDEGCTRPNRSMYCFEAGEIRVNEQLVLTCMHTLMAREHNRIAQALSQINPHWDDETLYQEARRIVIAEIQHITYNEFLPIILGKEVMEKFGLLTLKEGYWDGYDPTVNPNVIDAFAAAAFRFGHSLLPTAVERWSKAHKFIASKRLSNLIRRPYDLYRAGVFDEYFMGLMNQVAQAMDDSVTQEVTNHLFKKPGARFGLDLASFNMQRGREFGLPGYMEFRKFCGLPGAETFDELFGSMSNETIRRYSSIYEHPSDVDLWSGGVSERPLPGSMVGPTFGCIIATQFSYSRRGDRFWYELGNQPSSFTPEQLQEIRKVKLSRIICDNTDLIDTIQIYPMVLPDHEINPRVPCKSGIIPSMDLTKWADFGSQHSFVSNDFLVDIPQSIIAPLVHPSGLFKRLAVYSSAESRSTRTFHGNHKLAPLFGMA